MLSKKELGKFRDAREELHKKDEPYRRAANSDFIIYLLTLMAVAICIRTFIFEPVQCIGISMYPTLVGGEGMFTEKLTYTVSAPQRDDIIICRYPYHTEKCVKRVIAVPGDRISISDGAIYLNGEKLDEIYDKLVAIRTRMAKKLGFDNYIPLGYLRMQRNCYDQKDVEAFRASVRENLVPVAEEVCKKQAERLGVQYPLSFADEALFYRSGNARPVGTADDILANGRKFYHELSPETAEFIDVMLDSELMDVVAKKGKVGGGYCTSLPDYKVPFIFSNFNGTQGDVEVITHEAGHAFAGYMARNIVPTECQWPSLESCEIHSMSMEFFAWPWAGDFFGDQQDKFRYKHLSAALTFIPYGTMVDHFQHIVYEKPEMTPAERHAVWKELLGVYMPWMKLGSEIPFYGDGEGWQRQLHIYVNPFYYIDYCLAQTVALQFWARIQKDKDDAWKHYMAYTRQGGSRVFTELLKNADLDSPFEESCLRGVCEEAKAWLDSYDLTGIA